MTVSKKPTKEEKALLIQVAELQAEVARLSANSNHRLTSKLKSIMRQLAIWVCVVVCALMLNLGTAAIWLKRNVVNTAVWTDKTSQLMQAESVRTEIASQITDEIFSKADVEATVKEIIPPKISALSVPLTNNLKTFTSTKISELLASQKFQTYWTEANQSAHAGIIASLENGGKAPQDTSKYIVYISNDALLLNLQPIFSNIQTELSSKGLPFVGNVDPARLNKTVTITEIQSLPTVLQAFNIINKTAKLLPVIGILAGFLAVFLSKKKRNTILAICLTTAGLMILNVQLIFLAKYPLVEKASQALSTSSSQAAQDVFSILTNDLILIDRALLGISVIVFIAALLSGGGKIATNIRLFIARFTSPKSENKFFNFVADNAGILIAGIAAVSALLIVFPIVKGYVFPLIVITVASLLSIWALSIKTARKTLK